MKLVHTLIYTSALSLALLGVAHAHTPQQNLTNGHPGNPHQIEAQKDHVDILKQRPNILSDGVHAMKSDRDLKVEFGKSKNLL